MNIMLVSNCLEKLWFHATPDFKIFVLFTFNRHLYSNYIMILKVFMIFALK